MDCIRVLIADDHAPFRNGLLALLRSEPDIETIGEAAMGREAITQAATLQPDVILMDLHMPEVNGIEATHTILATSPHISILVLTMFEDDDSVFAALQAGARGYLLKGALKAEILRAIRGVSQGEAIFGPTIAKRLMSYFATLKPAAPALPIQPFPELTEREQEILALIQKNGDDEVEVARIHRFSRQVKPRAVLCCFGKERILTLSITSGQCIGCDGTYYDVAPDCSLGFFGKSKVVCLKILNVLL